MERPETRGVRPTLIMDTKQAAAALSTEQSDHRFLFSASKLPAQYSATPTTVYP
jgi:hypothetical protein